MSKKAIILWCAILIGSLAVLTAQTTNTATLKKASETMSETKDVNAPADMPKSEGDWKKRLNAQQYNVLREKGTERAFTGAYWNEHSKGTYKCAGCGAELFSSDTKFDSGTGWPSFYQPLDPTHVKTEDDFTYGHRTEVMCAKCGGHLGHVFDDGPKPTGKRYCINSVSLKLDKKE
jgi:peptide-methionine (R)-S-oxide reductase